MYNQFSKFMLRHAEIDHHAQAVQKLKLVRKDY